MTRQWKGRQWKVGATHGAVGRLGSVLDGRLGAKVIAEQVRYRLAEGGEDEEKKRIRQSMSK